MLIFNWNVNSLRSLIKKNVYKDKDLIDFIEFLKPDIICLQEIKMNNEHNAKELLASSFPEYKYIYCAVTHNSRAGVATLSKIKPISVKIDPIIGYPGRLICLKFTKFSLVNVYVPNSGHGLKNLDSRTTIWDPAFYDFLKRLRSQRRLLICGDFNVIDEPEDTFNFKAQRNKLAGVCDSERLNYKLMIEGLDLQNVLKHFGFTGSKGFTFYSYIFNTRLYNKGMSIDNFLCSKSLLKNIKGANILKNLYGSDHLGLCLEMDI